MAMELAVVVEVDSSMLLLKTSTEIRDGPFFVLFHVNCTESELASKQRSRIFQGGVGTRERKNLVPLNNTCLLHLRWWSRMTYSLHVYTRGGNRRRGLF